MCLPGGPASALTSARSSAPTFPLDHTRKGKLMPVFSGHSLTSSAIKTLSLTTEQMLVALVLF